MTPNPVTPNPEEVALVRAIVAAPDEDTPRLAYADWLDEHDRPARARLIRIQCDLARLQAEEQELIERHGQEWGGPLFALGADDWKFHRGFPEEVTMRVDDYLTEQSRLNDLTPLTRLHFRGGTDDDLRQLAALPAAARIRTLEVGLDVVHPNPLECGIEGVRALAASPHLAGLRQLRLHSHNLDANAVEVIAGVPAFANLTHLALTNPALRATPVENLVQLSRLSRLAELQLGDVRYGPQVLRLFRTPAAGQSDDRGPG
ncbi:MAG: TIGR02996 domain-containing protein [Gemmataceae bacterium]|nr:TIGR02996 domain-containing protein [Gemmataceae bacterium]